MNIVFWNIGKSLPPGKGVWLDRLITDRSPDLLCIAEGPQSKLATEKMVTAITSKGYRCYYSPLLDKAYNISNPYGWNSFGLKVFVKEGIGLKTKFSFVNQKVAGRIIYLRFMKDGKGYSTFFIHGTSKVGSIIDQNSFIVELTNLIRAKTLDKQNDGVIIIGDFNLEPWDDLLRDEQYIESYFYSKLFDYYSKKVSNKRGKLSKRIYRSPIFNYIETNSNDTLIGTFYKGNYISILDFPLLSSDVDNYAVEVITGLGVHSILIKKNNKHVLADGLDHLPISIKIV